MAVYNVILQPYKLKHNWPLTKQKKKQQNHIEVASPRHIIQIKNNFNLFPN